MELIDKQDAIKAIDDVLMEDKQYKVWLKLGINNLKPVDAQPVRHGKWKKIKGAINCSACKSCSWSMSFEDLVTSFNYCPNCGARMDADD